MKAAVRAFIALPLPSDLTALCAEAQRELQERCKLPGLRWVDSRQMHLTIKFLGDVAPAQVEAAADLVRAAASTVTACESSVTGLGAFANPRHARVLVVRLASSDALSGLASTLDIGASRLGVEPEGRAFHPHVTLARLRQPAPVTGLLAGIALPSLCFRLDRLVLFRSELGLKGASYSVLAEAPLSPRQSS